MLPTVVRQCRRSLGCHVGKWFVINIQYILPSSALGRVNYSTDSLRDVKGETERQRGSDNTQKPNSSVISEVPENYRFLAVQRVVKLFEEKYIHDIDTISKELEGRDLGTELRDMMAKGDISSAVSSPSMSLADRKVSDEKFDQIYEEIVGSRPPKWVKDESRKRAYVRSVSEDGENGPDRYIHDLRRSISPSVVEESNARLEFLALLGQTRDLLRSSSNVQDSFHELLTVYKKLPKPSIYAMRNRDLEKLSSIITDCLLQSGVDLSDDELLSIKSFFDESLDNGYGLTHKEYHSYCAVLTGLKHNQLDNRLEVLQKLRMAGVDIDSVYIGTTLSTVGNHHDWHSLQSFLEADGGMKKDVSTLIWVKGMELCRKEKDMLCFLALLQQFIDSYRISDFSSRVMNQEVLNSLLAFGFYSTSKRILTSLLLIEHDPLRTANPANLQLLDNFIRLGTIPKAYVLSNLKPDVGTFEPFFRHLSKFPGSKKEMSELIDMMLDHRLHLGDNIIWFILESVGEFQGWKRRQVADLILELDSKPSNTMINHTEFIALRSIFDFYRFKEVTNKRIKVLEYHKGLTRSDCLRYFLDNYKLE